MNIIPPSLEVLQQNEVFAAFPALDLATIEPHLAWLELMCALQSTRASASGSKHSETEQNDAVKSGGYPLLGRPRRGEALRDHVAAFREPLERASETNGSRLHAGQRLERQLVGAVERNPDGEERTERCRRSVQSGEVPARRLSPTHWKFQRKIRAS